MTTHRPTPVKREKRATALRAKAAKRPPFIRPSAVAALDVYPAEARPAGGEALRIVLAAILLACGIWSYLPTLENLARTWWQVSDYWHGFLIIPLAIYFLHARRDRYPGLKNTSPLLALVFFAVALALRHAGDALYFAFMDGWSLIPWTAAVVAILGGRPLLAWAAPSIVYLVFLIPLPFSIETEFSGSLQRLATTMSTAVLQFLGQPAFAEGNVILIGSAQMGVAEACSGLKMFVGTLSLMYAYVVIIRRPWWEKALVVLAAVPVAILSNVTRIVATGLVFQATTNEQVRFWAHEAAGIAMYPLAAVLFWLLLAYLRLLVREEEIMDMTTVVKQCRV